MSLHAIEAFRTSMPDAYRLSHADDEIRRHAEAVGRRGDTLAHLELLASETEGVSTIVVVTDDRPGLLSVLSAAISAHSLDILGAKIYCRAREGRPDEAVDFFLVRPLKTAF